MKSVKFAFGLSLVLLSGAALAQSPAGKGPGSDGEQVYGSQIMTQQERLEYRNRMREATTQEEREQIRVQHHEQMRERAKERGVTLPEDPPARGMGGGMGSGAGGGMGSGAGGGMGGGAGGGTGGGMGKGGR